MSPAANLSGSLDEFGERETPVARALCRNPTEPTHFLVQHLPDAEAVANVHCACPGLPKRWSGKKRYTHARAGKGGFKGPKWV